MTYSVVCKEKNMAVESQSVSCKRSRKSNWNVRDEIVVVEVVEKRKDVLFGQLTGSGRTALDKAKAWQEVANVVNSWVKYASEIEFDIISEFRFGIIIYEDQHLIYNML